MPRSPLSIPCSAWRAARSASTRANCAVPLGDNCRRLLSYDIEYVVGQYERFRDRHRHVLRGDVYHYFSAIDHAILKADLRRRIACRRTLAVLDRIIDGLNPQEPVHHYYLLTHGRACLPRRGRPRQEREWFRRRGPRSSASWERRASCR